MFALQVAAVVADLRQQFLHGNAVGHIPVRAEDQIAQAAREHGRVLAQVTFTHNHFEFQ